MNYTPPTYDNSDLEKLKDLKNKFVKRQDYDTAAKLRDIEKVLMNNIDRDKELELKRLENNTSFTKEQVKSLLDSAVETHEQKIIELNVNIARNETKIKELESTVLHTANLSLEFGSYLLKYFENIGEHVKPVEMLYDEFLTERFKVKNETNNIDPDNGESLWVKTE